MQIKDMSVDQLVPYAKNPRNNIAAVEIVKTSLKEYGFKQPIVVDTSNVIIVGHTRYNAALELGLETVPVLVADDLTEDQIRAYRIMDNRSAEFADWDEALLIQEIDQLHNIDVELTGFTQADLEKMLEQDELANLYTDKIQIPHYTPKGENPHESELVDVDYCTSLKEEINNTELPQEISEFLLMAADRHRIFDYKKIAEYYCHADEQTQTLMEKSALIIVDFDSAIEYGFVQLTEDIKTAYGEDHGT